MTYWIMSANSKKYNHSLALKELGYIDWKKKRNYEKGDCVFLYITAPVSRVQYQLVVTKTDLSVKDIASTRYFTSEPSISETDKFVRLELVAYKDSEKLSMSELSKHGMNYPPQGPMRLQEDTANYICRVMESK